MHWPFIMCGYMNRRTCFGFGECDKNKEKMKQATLIFRGHWQIFFLYDMIFEIVLGGLAWNKGGKVS